MSALFPLFIALWSLVSGHVAIHQLDGPVKFTDLYGSPRTAEAATGCPGGKAELWLSPDVGWETLVHELAHVHDCNDDGLMNNSPSSRPATRPGWVSDYCWSSDAEWYACSVVYYRNLHPDTAATWPRPAATRAVSAPARQVTVPKAGTAPARTATGARSAAGAR